MAIHVAITRHVRAGREGEFTSALQAFFSETLTFEGMRGAHMFVPPPGDGSREYGILRTFASEEARDAFYASPSFAAWEARVAPLVEGPPVYRTLDGLEAFFREGSGRPPRWKMAVATLGGVYPTSLLLGATVAPVVHDWPLPARSLVFAALMVPLLTWVVMPLVVRLLVGWLHPAAHVGSMAGRASGGRTS